MKSKKKSYLKAGISVIICVFLITASIITVTGTLSKTYIQKSESKISLMNKKAIDLKNKNKIYFL